MALGPGKYDDIATDCLEKTQADAIVLIVWNGNRGSGISGKELSTDFDIVMRSAPQIPKKLPAVLREIARTIEAEG